ncbi:hypothetical protein [Nannocystis pusilla]|uniref:hypothetical protein n=1 Tax=Nannocystis pusilla TaxID=889268 RepID=UPI003B813F5C
MGLDLVGVEDTGQRFQADQWFGHCLSLHAALRARVVGTSDAPASAAATILPRHLASRLR